MNYLLVFQGAPGVSLELLLSAILDTIICSIMILPISAMIMQLLAAFWEQLSRSGGVRLSITWATLWSSGSVLEFPGSCFESPFGYQHLQYHDTASFGHDNAALGGFLGSALGSKQVRFVRFEHSMNYLLVCQGPPGVSQELPLRAFLGTNICSIMILQVSVTIMQLLAAFWYQLCGPRRSV